MLAGDWADSCGQSSSAQQCYFGPSVPWGCNIALLPSHVFLLLNIYYLFFFFLKCSLDKNVECIEAIIICQLINKNSKFWLCIPRPEMFSGTIMALFIFFLLRSRLAPWVPRKADSDSCFSSGLLVTLVFLPGYHSSHSASSLRPCAFSPRL